MSAHIVRSASTDAAVGSRRGQSFVEFALVLPMLLVLLLGIADFGRAFVTGIIVEAATRSAAEVAAQEYLQAIRQGAVPGVSVDYDDVHLAAARVACQETQNLPNTTFSADAQGGTCPTEPIIRVCVHDQYDPNCGDPAMGFAGAIPSACTVTDGDGVPSSSADPAWYPSKDGSPLGEDSIYVEVRVCYRFTTLFNLKLSLPMNVGLNLGELFLQDRSVFTVADY